MKHMFEGIWKSSHSDEDEDEDEDESEDDFWGWGIQLIFWSIKMFKDNIDDPLFVKKTRFGRTWIVLNSCKL